MDLDFYLGDDADDYEEWLYVEEGDELSDDLAIGLLPEPLFNQSLYDDYVLDYETSHVDEQEHDSGDCERVILGRANTIHDPTQKRKRVDNNGLPDHAKRRKSSLTGWTGIDSGATRSIVVWRSASMTTGVQSKPYRPCQAHATLPDWRVRFKDYDDWPVKVSSTPTAAEQTRDLPPRPKVESEEDGPAAAAEVAMTDAPPRPDSTGSNATSNAQTPVSEQDFEHVNPVAAMLEGRLADIPLSTEQRASIVARLGQVAAGSGEVDLETILGEITECVLDAASKEGGERAAQWLREQGLSLEDQEWETDDAMSQHTGLDEELDSARGAQGLSKTPQTERTPMPVEGQERVRSKETNEPGVSEHDQASGHRDETSPRSTYRPSTDQVHQSDRSERAGRVSSGDSGVAVEDSAPSALRRTPIKARARDDAGANADADMGDVIALAESTDNHNGQIEDMIEVRSAGSKKRRKSSSRRSHGKVHDEPTTPGPSARNGVTSPRASASRRSGGTVRSVKSAITDSNSEALEASKGVITVRKPTVAGSPPASPSHSTSSGPGDVIEVAKSSKSADIFTSDTGLEDVIAVGRTLSPVKPTAADASVDLEDTIEVSKAPTSAASSKRADKKDKPASAGPSRASRKRKAAPESEPPSSAPTKRQQRSFAAPTASSTKRSEAAAKSTRSTRSRK